MFSYQNLTKDNYLYVSEFIADNFVTYEPVTKYLNIQLKDFLLFTNCVCKHAIADNMSVIAVDENQKIAGAVICYDLAKEVVLPKNLNDNLLIILDMLSQLDERVMISLKNDKKIAYISLMAIECIYRPTQLFKDILLRLAISAKAQEYKIFYAQETSEYRFRINDFPGKVVEIGSTIYKDFIFNAQKPFINLLGRCAAIKVMM